jgi:hypothetical protein
MAHELGHVLAWFFDLQKLLPIFPEDKKRLMWLVFDSSVPQTGLTRPENADSGEILRF